MSTPPDIISIVKEIKAWYQRATFSASDEQVYVMQAAKHFIPVAEALLIAVAVLEKYQTLPSLTFQGTIEDLFLPAKKALARIRSLPSA